MRKSPAAFDSAAFVIVGCLCGAAGRTSPPPQRSEDSRQDGADFLVARPVRLTFNFFAHRCGIPSITIDQLRGRERAWCRGRRRPLRWSFQQPGTAEHRLRTHKFPKACRDRHCAESSCRMVNGGSCDRMRPASPERAKALEKPGTIVPAALNGLAAAKKVPATVDGRQECP